MTITLAGNRILFYLGHLQLVKSGLETEVQAPYPQRFPFFGTWDFGDSFTKPHTVSPQSTIGDPETYSSAAVEFTSGIDEEGAWDIFEQVRAQLIPLKLPYDVNLNSNTYVNTLLSAIDHSAEEFITYPTTVSIYPGMETDIASGFWGLDYSLHGGENGDAIRGGRGNDNLYGGAGIDFLKGGKGSDNLYANSASNLADGGADYLEGGSGRDTFYVGGSTGGLFLYNPDAGVTTFNVAARGTYDVILDYTKFDRIMVSVFGGPATDFSNFTVTSAGYSIDDKDVYFADANGLRLSAIYDSYYDNNLGRNIDVMVFWYQILARSATLEEVNTPLFAIETSPAEISSFSISSVITGTQADDSLTGSIANETIFGGGGSDVISGGDGDDVLYGDDGDDDFFAYDDDGADIYDGGAGTNSFIYEGDADLVIDTGAGTISATGQALDSFTNITAFYGSNGDDTFIDSDGMRFFNGAVGNDSVILLRNVSDYRIYSGGTGYNIERAYLDRDQLFDGKWLRIENIENISFNGVSVSLQDVLVNQINGTSAGEAINGTNGSDFIDAGSGDDILYGGLGSDLLSGGEGINRADFDGYRDDYDFKLNADGTVSVSNSTYGYDVLANIQSVFFRDENTEYQIDQLINTVPEPTVQGTSGNDTLEGTWGDDVFHGGLGDDLLLGSAGSDTYIYASGDGNDYINDEAGFTDNTDVLLLTDLNADDISLARNGVHLEITVLATGHVITIDEQFYSDVDYWGIEKIQFDDGSFMGRGDILAAVNTALPVVTVQGTSGNDTLEGTWGDDVFHGGLGDDLLLGSAGSDTYIYVSGDGNDYIDDEAGFTDNTDVLLLTDLNAGDISLARNGVHLEITVIATGHTITIDEQFYSDVDYWGIEKIQFADGSFMDRDDILDAVTPSAGRISTPSETGANLSPAETSDSSADTDLIVFDTGATDSITADPEPSYTAALETTSNAGEQASAVHSAEIISLSDYLGNSSVSDQSDDLWYQPEPIGAVV